MRFRNLAGVSALLFFGTSTAIAQQINVGDAVKLSGGDINVGDEILVKDGSVQIGSPTGTRSTTESNTSVTERVTTDHNKVAGINSEISREASSQKTQTTETVTNKNNTQHVAGRGKTPSNSIEGRAAYSRSSKQTTQHRTEVTNSSTTGTSTTKSTATQSTDDIAVTKDGVRVGNGISVDSDGVRVGGMHIGN